MPTIKLTDQLGFEVDAEINPDSAIAKYIKSRPCTKNHAHPGNHVNPVKLTFGHRHKQLFLQDYKIRPDLHDGSDNHLGPCDVTFVQSLKSLFKWAVVSEVTEMPSCVWGQEGICGLASY